MTQTTIGLIKRMKKFLHLDCVEMKLYFFKQKEYSVLDYADEDHTGQYIIRYKNGTFECWPGSMHGNEFRRIYGYKILKIREWAFLPDMHSKTSIELFPRINNIPSFITEKGVHPYDYVRATKGEFEGYQIPRIESEISGASD